MECGSRVYRLTNSFWVPWSLRFNALRPRRNEQHFAGDIFKRIFFNENVWISIKISLKFIPKGPINNIPALVQIMAWRRLGDKPLSEPMMVSLTTHICVTELIHWGWDKMAAIFQATVSNTCSWINVCWFQLKFHWCLFPWVQLTITALFQIMAWHWPGDKPLSEPKMIIWLTHICGTWPQWVKWSILFFRNTKYLAVKTFL